MTSFDSNVLLYAFDRRCVEHERARLAVEEHSGSTGVVICELVLLELYLLLRNPVVVGRALGAPEAVAVCEAYRNHPRWRLVETAPVMSAVWSYADQPGLARRRIVDARLAYTLRHHGVTRLITRNVKHFVGFGFEQVVDPFAAR